MLKQKILSPIVFLLALMVFAGACGVSPTPVPPTPTQIAAGADVEQKPAETTTPAPTLPPTETPEPTPSPAAPAVRGFVLFDKEKAEFQAYALDGELLYTSPAPGSSFYPSVFNLTIVGDTIYYKIDRNRAENIEPQFIRTSPESTEKVTIVPAESMAASTVSPDETWIAWSTLGPEDPVSELWITNLKTSEARKIATYSLSQDEAFFLRPFGWTEDGKLLFERGLTGLGGYILYGGHNSLYTYDPSSGAIETIVPAEEKHSLCLDSYHPAQDTVIFHCGHQKQEMIIRSLKDGSEKVLPKLPGQGVAGGAHYSPSGKWLAYAIAENNPDNESGQVVVVPADLSAPPQAIAAVKDNSFPSVMGWLDDDTLVINRNHWPDITTWTVRRDGSDLKQIVSGFWIGWLR